jgi:hypothetical protein
MTTANSSALALPFPLSHTRPAGSSDAFILYETLARNSSGSDGFTVDAGGHFVFRDDGYAVGIRGFANPRDLAQFVADNPQYYAGFWRDDAGHEVWDAVQIVEDLAEAIALGIQHNQMAIFDFAIGDCIRINNTASVWLAENFANAEAV